MAHSHKATVAWQRGDAAFTDNRYSRGHEWRFDEGITVPASASPHVVRAPFSVARAVDPEEALVASASSCHMLSFLYIVARRGFVVDRYEDEAEGVLDKDGAGRQSITRITLRPRIAFSGTKRPSPEELEAMHHEAHEACFIANSLKSEILVEPA